MPHVFNYLVSLRKLAALKLVEAIPLEYLSGLRNVADDGGFLYFFHETV